MWVDAEKEKPETRKRVLIAYQDRWKNLAVTIGWYAPRFTVESRTFDYMAHEYYLVEGWVDESRESEYHYPIDNVTHWQPLPKHPKLNKGY